MTKINNDRNKKPEENKEKSPKKRKLRIQNLKTENLKEKKMQILMKKLDWLIQII